MGRKNRAQYSAFARNASFEIRGTNRPANPMYQRITEKFSRDMKNRLCWRGCCAVLFCLGSASLFLFLARSPSWISDSHKTPINVNSKSDSVSPVSIRTTVGILLSVNAYMSLVSGTIW